MAALPTPGPWHLEGVDRNGERIIAREGRRVASVAIRNGAAERDATAKLIAAAPKMRSLLQAAAEQLEEWAGSLAVDPDHEQGIVNGMREVAADYRALLADI